MKKYRSYWKHERSSPIGMIGAGVASILAIASFLDGSVPGLWMAGFFGLVVAVIFVGDYIDWKKNG